MRNNRLVGFLSAWLIVLPKFYDKTSHVYMQPCLQWRGFLVFLMEMRGSFISWAWRHTILEVFTSSKQVVSPLLELLYFLFVGIGHWFIHFFESFVFVSMRSSNEGSPEGCFFCSLTPRFLSLTCSRSWSKYVCILNLLIFGCLWLWLNTFTVLLILIVTNPGHQSHASSFLHAIPTASS